MLLVGGGKDRCAYLPAVEHATEAILAAQLLHRELPGRIPASPVLCYNIYGYTSYQCTHMHTSTHSSLHLQIRDVVFMASSPTADLAAFEPMNDTEEIITSLYNHCLQRKVLASSPELSVVSRASLSARDYYTDEVTGTTDFCKWIDASISQEYREGVKQVIPVFLCSSAVADGSGEML